MDYYQGVVVEYLRANRSVFVNTECCIQVNSSTNPDASGPHWYCDAVAVDFERKTVFLCEVTYSKSLAAVSKRLASWNTYWIELRAALVRDCHLPADWPVIPWLFVPSKLEPTAKAKAALIGMGPGQTRRLPPAKIVTLESVAPWNYPAWNRKDEDDEAHSVAEKAVD